MVQTIVTASHISVQGTFVRQMIDGRIMVRVGDTFYVGNPVETVKPRAHEAVLSATA